MRLIVALLPMFLMACVSTKNQSQNGRIKRQVASESINFTQQQSIELVKLTNSTEVVSLDCGSGDFDAGPLFCTIEYPGYAECIKSGEDTCDGFQEDLSPEDSSAVFQILVEAKVRELPRPRGIYSHSIQHITCDTIITDNKPTLEPNGTCSAIY